MIQKLIAAVCSGVAIQNQSLFRKTRGEVSEVGDYLLLVRGINKSCIMTDFKMIHKEFSFFPFKRFNFKFISITCQQKIVV